MYVQQPKVGLALGLGGVSVYSVAMALFNNGEQGAWYDPSDFSTMFQDTAGATPVTAVGQVVGLVLDKSKGLAVGSNTIPSLDFTDTVNWLAAAGGTLTRNSASSFTTTASGGLRNAAAVTVGLWYQITFNYTTTAGFGVRNATFNANTVGTDVSAGSGTFTAFFNALDTNLYFRLAAAGTVTVTNLSVTSLAGNHATQATAASKPLLQQDATGRYYLLFDGTDDFLVTPTITPGTDKVQVFAGVRKLSDATRGSVLGFSTTPDASNGSFEMFAPGLDAEASYGIASRGTTQASTRGTTFTAPITNVLTGLGDIPGDSAILRANGTQANFSTADQGTGNYLAYPHYIGRRGGTSQPFNGRIYQLICRFGSNLTAAQIQQVETFVNQRTGAY